MKNTIHYILVILVFSCTLISCTKKQDNKPADNNALPAPVNSVITAAIIDSLQKHGAIINKGTTPPTINGIFLIHPDVCTFDNSGGGFAGSTFDDYKYKFSNQSKTAYTIRVDYIDVNFPAEVTSDSVATYVSGHDNLFTIYSSFNTSKNGVNFVILHVLSGEIASGGIKNFQNSTYIVSKDADPNHYVEPQGATRVFYDSDLFSEVQMYFNES
jgi:hypothetical protein